MADLPDYVKESLGDVGPQYGVSQAMLENPINSEQGQVDFSTPTVSQSVGAAIENTPVWQDVKQFAEHVALPTDPDYDPSVDLDKAGQTLGYAEASKLNNVGSQAEFNIRYQDLLTQQANSRLAASTVLGSATNMVAQMGTAQNILSAIVTGGATSLGTVASSLEAGVTANTIKAAAGALAGSAIGGYADYTSNLGMSYEDIAWGAAINTVLAAPIGRYYGNVYEPPVESINSGRLFDVTGAMGDAASRAYARFRGEGFTSYARKAAEQAALKDKFAGIFRSGDRPEMYDADIQHMDWSDLIAQDADLDKAVGQWMEDNAIPLREKNMTWLEEKANMAPDLANSLYGQMFNSGNPKAKALAIMMLESGTGAMTMNQSFSAMREVLKQDFWSRYGRAYDLYRGQYAKDATEAAIPRQPGLINTKDRAVYRIKNFFAHKAQFDQDVVLYANMKRAGNLKDVKFSKNVTDYFDRFVEPTNKYVFDHMQREGVLGWDAIKYQEGYMPQRHVPEFYQRALAKFGGGKAGRKELSTLIKKAIMSPAGSGITEGTKAGKIARAFVDRFIDGTSNVDIRRALPDEAWQYLEEAFQEHGVDLDPSLKESVQKGIGNKFAKDRGRITQGRQRVNLDLTVSHKGVRMLDLIDTDVQNLLGNYAIQMSGHVALAKSGFKSIYDFDKVVNSIREANPKLGKMLDHLSSGVRYDRPAEVRGELARNLLRAGNLAFLNNVGAVQLSESGTATVALGVRNVLSNAGAVARDMWYGRKSVSADKLAEELSQALWYVGREHWFVKPHMMKELASNSTLASATMADKLRSIPGLLMDLQGYTSGFNLVRTLQQMTYAKSYLNLITKALHTEGPLGKTGRFLSSMGFNKKLLTDVAEQARKYGTKDEQGTFLWNLEKWDSDVRDNLTYSVVRNMHTMSQRRMLGETIPFMSTDTGAVLGQFMSYPILALRKQLIRGATLGSPELAAMSLHSAIVAGAVITARNYMTGANTDIGLDQMLRNGITYSAELGPLSQFWDLGISLSGAPDAMHINPWSALHEDTIAPPGLAAMNAWLDLGKLPIDYLSKDKLSSTDYRALRALPIIGNYALFGRMFRPDKQ